jgi:hypothetical protein
MYKIQIEVYQRVSNPVCYVILRDIHAGRAPELGI